MTSINNSDLLRSSEIVPKKCDQFVKFIHASDIHLGSHQYSNSHRSDDFIRALEEILSLAIKNQVDFIILGGDIFTSLEMLPGKLTKIVNVLKNFKLCTNGTIPIIAIEGNHDIRKFSRGVRFDQRGQSWLKLLAGLGLIILLDTDIEAEPEKMFPTYNFKLGKGGKIKIKSAIIYGNCYLGQDPEIYLPKIKEAIRNDGLFHILLQHFGIKGQIENVPGVKLEKVQILKDRVDYLALGHYHKQFTLNQWIYNPGSSEAVCSVDSSYKRGIFLVEVFIEKNYSKRVHFIRLNNRKYIWDTIHFPHQLRNKYKINNFIFQRLKSSLKYLKTDLKPSDSNMPILYLILKGKKPLKNSKIDNKVLNKIICENLPVVEVKIYQKFSESTNTIDKYLISRK